MSDPTSRSLLTLLTTPLEWLAMGAVLGLMVHVVADVAMRFLLNSPMYGTTQYVQYVWMVLIAAIGFGVAERREEHIEVTLVTGILPAPIGFRMHQYFSRLVAAAFYLLIIYFGLAEGLKQATIGEYEAVTRFPIWPSRFAVPLGATMSLMWLGLRWWRGLPRARRVAP